ncbi:MAG: extracellular solute-binding protein [Bacilli bacterium]|jgi:multiple sugar transport system substrate-binding protein|nr:extracellular solute-binding protein [Bacilli bacterium]
MNKLKKILPASVMLLSMLAACSNTNSAASSGAASSKTDPFEVPSDYVAFTGDEQNITATIDFWETFGGGTSPNATFATAMATEFHKRYPNITVNLVNHNSYTGIYTDISNAIPAGTAPTMAICYPDHVASYLSAGAVENLAGYVADPTIGLGVDDLTQAGGKEDFVSSYIDEGIEYANPGVYSMPYSKSTEVMFYNKTVFDAKGWQVPTTWDEMWNLCKEVKDSGDFPKVTPLGYDSDDNLFITYLQQAGIPYTSVSNPHYLFNNDQAKAFIRDFKSKFDAGYFTTKGTSANSSYTSTQFTAQSLFMTVGSTGGTSYNYTDDFNIGVAGIPQVDTESPKVIQQGPSVCIFKRATTAQKQAAWLFYKFITNSVNSANLASLTGYSPVRASSYETEYWKQWIEDSTGAGGQNNLIATAETYVQNHYQTAFYTSPAFKGSSTARTEVGGLFSSVMLGTKDVDTAFQDAMGACALITD